MGNEPKYDFSATMGSRGRFILRDLNDVASTAVSGSSAPNACYSGGFKPKGSQRPIRKEALPIPIDPIFDYPQDKGGWARINGGRWMHYCVACGEPNGPHGGLRCNACHALDSGLAQKEKKRTKGEARRITRAIKEHTWKRKVMLFRSGRLRLDIEIGEDKQALHAFFSFEEEASPADILVAKEDYESFVKECWPAIPENYQPPRPIRLPIKKPKRRPAAMWGYA